jgi:hypothetical protein
MSKLLVHCNQQVHRRPRNRLLRDGEVVKLLAMRVGRIYGLDSWYGLSRSALLRGLREMSLQLRRLVPAGKALFCDYADAVGVAMLSSNWGSCDSEVHTKLRQPCASE